MHHQSSDMIRINNPQYFHFLQQADVLRRSGSLCDAIISVRSQIFRAHRLVLACASRALAQQLARAGADSPVHCTLEYFSPHTFQQVLDFTYTQALEVSVRDLHLLLRAAQLLEMQQLEEQCRKQLDTLDVRASQEEEEEGEEEEGGQQEEEDWRGGVKDAKEEKNSPEKRNQKQKEALIQTDNHTKSSPSCDPPQDHDDPPSTTKKSRLSPVPVLCSRDSVITRPSSTTTTTTTSSSSSSTSSLSSPWTFSANMWDSVSTLRRIAENYSNFFSAHSLQTPSQSSGAHPFSLSLSTPHMVPLLGSHFQAPVQSSVMSYSGFHPRHTQSLYTGATRMSSIIKQGLLKRSKPHYSGNAQTSEGRYAEVVQTSTETEKVCHRCSASSCHDPVTQKSTSAKPGKRCRGCRLCGREDVLQPETRRDHRGEKPYQCRHCPKTFSLKHQLDTHHRVHTGEKPFECRLCGQRSRDYSAMIKHLRTHGGAAPYQCTLCLEFCSSLVAMQRHVKSHEVQDFPPDWNISSTYLYISHISA